MLNPLHGGSIVILKEGFKVLTNASLCESFTHLTKEVYYIHISFSCMIIFTTFYCSDISAPSRLLCKHI